MKILMVCLGNICRSPLAQGILENKSTNLNIEIDSAATASYHIGKKPDIRSIEIAKKNNIDITNQSARQFSMDDFKKFDIIYAMDKNNYNHLFSLATTKEDRKKIKLILNEISPKNESVPDPYYGGNNGFKNVYTILNDACDQIIKNLE